jgi:hypothetical protein
MILLIDIFIRVDMIYGKVLLVNASCTQWYDDSDEIATIRERFVYINDTQQVHVIGLNHIFQRRYPQR